MTPGWYPDPSGRFEHRYHNGRMWTADVAVDGERYVDHGAPGAPPPPGRERGSNTAATAALVCGIVSLAIGWLPVLFVAGFVLAGAAIVLGTVGLRRAPSRGGAGRGFAGAGVLTGSFGMLGSVGGLVLTIVTFDAIERYTDPGPATVSMPVCEVRDSRLAVAGELRNDGTGVADYTVLYEVRRAGTDDVVLRVREPLRDVAPGATATFEASERTTVETVECEVVEITGPPPFGLAP